jgi:hypothetical protein
LWELRKVLREGGGSARSVAEADDFAGDAFRDATSRVEGPSIGRPARAPRFGEASIAALTIPAVDKFSPGPFVDKYGVLRH